MDYKAYIETNPEIMLGKPVFAKTRIPVDLILEKLSEGMTIETVLEAYPNLSADHLAAAFAYSAELIRMDEPVSA